MLGLFTTALTHVASSTLDAPSVVRGVLGAVCPR